MYLLGSWCVAERAAPKIKMEKRIVLIESNSSGTGRLFAKTARRLGFEPLLIAEDPTRYPYVAEDHVEVIRQSCCNNLDALEATIRQVALRAEVAGIYSSSEYFIEAAAELARRFGLNGPDLIAIPTCRNKWRQRVCLKNAGIRVPVFARVTSVQEAVDALEVIPPPVVLKPTQGSGSVGVRLCRDQWEVKNHAEALLGMRFNERGMDITPEALLEEYIKGNEYSAEVLSSVVLGITRKHVSREPYFVETGHDFPASLPGPLQAEIKAVVSSAVKAVGMTWGQLHVELRCRGNDVIIMEVNPRLAGGFIPEIVRLATGADMIQQTILLLTGQKADTLRLKDSYASIRFICPQIEGRIADIKGFHNAGLMAGVANVQMYKNIGDRLTIHHDFRDRIGHVISCGPHQDLVIQSAEFARNAIQIEIQS